MQEALQLKAFFQSKIPMLLLLGKHNAQRGALLTQATTFPTPDQMVLRLKGKTTYEPSTLAALFQNHWAIHIKLSDNRLDAQFDEILACLTAQKQSCVLLIDHANLLPIPVLAALCHLCYKQENQFIAIRIILAGQESLTPKIDALYLKKFAFPPVITLPNMAPKRHVKKKNQPGQKSLWQRHRVKSMAVASLFVSCMVLWNVEHHGFIALNHHDVVHEQKQVFHA